MLRPPSRASVSKPVLDHRTWLRPALGRLAFGITGSVSVVAGLLNATTVYAAPLTFSTTAIALTSPAIDLTLASGSTADALTVNATSVVVSLSASGGNSFTLTSAARDLTVTASAGGGTYPVTCVGSGLTGVNGIDRVVITQQSGSAAYTIVPAGTQCMSVNKSLGGTTVYPIEIHLPSYASTTAGHTVEIPITVNDPNGYEPTVSATLPDDATFSTSALRLAWSPSATGTESSTISVSDPVTKNSACIILQAFESVASETVANAMPNRTSNTTRALSASTPRRPTIETLKANIAVLESKLLGLLDEYLNILLKEARNLSSVAPTTR